MSFEKAGQVKDPSAIAARRRDPGAHSGAWLTSVMLAIRPDLVDLASVEAGLSDEVHAATATKGADLLERFASSIVEQVQDAARRATPLPP